MKNQSLNWCLLLLATMWAAGSFLGLGLVLPAAAKVKSPSVVTASKDDPGCRPCVSQAASMFASGKDLEAAELLRQWQNRCPHNVQLHLLLSTILVRLGGKGGEAEQAAALAVTASPTSVPARLQYALVLMGNGNHVQASQQFEKVVELEPNNYEAWSSLSSLYKALQEDERAEQCAARAADLEPATRSVRLKTLRNLERAGKLNEATAELKRLIGNREYGPEFMQELANEAMRLGAYDEAIQSCELASQAYPKSMAPLKTMALAQYFKHDFQSCLQTSKRMLTLDPGQADGSSLAGLALVKLGRTDEADKGIQEVLSRHPESALALLALGSLQFVKGEYDQSSTSLERSVEMDPTLGQYPELCFTLAQALDKQEEHEFALSYYKKSLSNGLTGEEAAVARQAVQRLESTGKETGDKSSRVTLPPVSAGE